jgi:ferredoxin
MAKKIKVKEGCVGCQACLAVLSEDEQNILEKYMVVGDDMLMKSTGKSTDDEKEIEIMEKAANACPTAIIEIVEA